MLKKLAILIAFLLVMHPLGGLIVLDCSAENKPFLPIWKLLNSTEKAQFISGYLHGWSDARNVTGIAIDFIKDNPNKAVNSLEDIKKLYDVSLLRPEELVAAVDNFYENSENKAAPLSVAVTAAKNKASK